MTAAADISSPCQPPAETLATETLNPEGADDESLGGARGNNHGLPSRNVFIDGKRTSIRLDTYSLDSLYEIAERERISIHELCTMIHRRNRQDPFTLTAALRIFLLTYFRMAATEDGHRGAGHGPRPAPGSSPFSDDAPSVSSQPVPRRNRTGAGRRPPSGTRTGGRQDHSLESLAESPRPS